MADSEAWKPCHSLAVTLHMSDFAEAVQERSLDFALAAGARCTADLAVDHPLEDQHHTDC